MKKYCYAIISTFLLCVSATCADRPNVVFFLLDDLGVNDLGCYGSTFHETPNLDRLAAEGVRFSNAYAAHPVCGPSRSAIITGRLPGRLGVTAVGGSIKGHGMPWPKVFQQAGYRTYFTGKWHMGGAETILRSGFHVNVAGNHNGQPSNFYYPYKKGPGHYGQDVPGMSDGKEGDYLTDKLTDKALHFLGNNHTKPFLLYISYYQTHKPYVKPAQGKVEDVAYFNKKLAGLAATDGPATRQVKHGNGTAVESLEQRNAEFAAQIKSVDDNVGRVVDRLEALGLTDNTIIVFTSDQGSVCASGVSDEMQTFLVSTQKPYRMGKGWLFEGGVRVPLIIKWPALIKTPSVNETVTVSTDLYPTLLDLVGLPLRPAQHLDGVSIKPALAGQTIPFTRPIHWVYNTPHAHLGHKPCVAVRKGDHKLIYWLADGHTELYDVVADIGEDHDLSGTHPELLQQMLKELRKPAYMSRYIK